MWRFLVMTLALFSLFAIPLIATGCTGGSGYDYDEEEDWDDEPVGVESTSPPPASTQPRETAGETVDTGQGFRIAGGPNVSGVSRGGSFGSQTNFNHYRNGGRAASEAEKLFAQYIKQRAASGSGDSGLIDQALSKIDQAIAEYNQIKGLTGQLKEEVEEAISDAYNMRSSIIREQ